MIPLGELAAELVLAVGGALFAANLWVLLRPVVQRPKKGKRVPRPASMTRVYVNLVVGAVASVWAVATLVTRR
jgi:predicted PurR-regulated permease PerM